MPAPTNTIAPAISGEPYQTNLMTTTNGTWANTPTIFTYQWQRGGVNIGGATASTYVVTHADEGHNLSSLVVATNGSGSSPPASSGATLVLTLLLNYLTNLPTATVSRTVNLEYETDLPKATVARTVNTLGSLGLTGGRPTFGQLWPRGEGLAR